MRDARPKGQAEDKRRSLIGCFRPRRQSKLASEEELEKAAQYVVARFGAFESEDVSDEEEEGAEDLEGKVTTATSPAPHPPACCYLSQTHDTGRHNLSSCAN